VAVASTATSRTVNGSTRGCAAAGIASAASVSAIAAASARTGIGIAEARGARPWTSVSYPVRCPADTGAGRAARIWHGDGMSGNRAPRAEASYREAGVDIDAGDALVEAIKPLREATRRPAPTRDRRLRRAVRPRAPAFAIRAGRATDGVGTKLKSRSRAAARPARHRPRRDVRQRSGRPGRRAAASSSTTSRPEALAERRRAR
jgi:hypothetical protein